jgi:signal transduction histidine kinase
VSLFSRIFLAHLLSITLILAVGLLAIWMGSGAAARRWREMAVANLEFHKQTLQPMIDHSPLSELRHYVQRIPESSTVHGYLLAWPADEASLSKLPAYDQQQLMQLIEEDSSFNANSIVLMRFRSVGEHQAIILLTQPFPFDEVFKAPLTVGTRLGIGLLIILIVTWLTSRHISRPLRYLRDQMTAYHPNDASIELPNPLLNRNDEVGALARGFGQMAQRVRSLIDARERLLGDVAHELRSPLARQVIALELLRSRPDDPAIIQQLERENQRMDSLLSDLTQISRAESGGGLRDLSSIALKRIVEDVLHDARLEAEARPCRLVLRSAVQGVLSGSYELLRRAIENVIRNAIRHTAENTDVEIALKHGPHNTYEILVRDHGPGVSAEDLAHLFEPFFRTQPSRDRATGGSGLGLAIADRAVRAHGGTAEAANAPGGGLKVTLRIPEATPSA